MKISFNPLGSLLVSSLLKIPSDRSLTVAAHFVKDATSTEFGPLIATNSVWANCYAPELNGLASWVSSVAGWSKLHSLRRTNGES